MEMIFQNSIDALVALVIALIAVWQYFKAGNAEKKTSSVIAALTPGDDSVTIAPDILPGRSWKMTDETKRWLTFDHPADEAKSLLDQVASAEANRLIDYQITYPSGYYNISAGLVAGGARGF
jgi:hypothetical protein